MKLNQVTEILFKIADTSSTSEKKLILKENKSDVLKKIFKMTYHPDINFGVKKVDLDNLKYGNDEIEWGTLWELLEKLQDRELTGNAARDAILSELTGKPIAYEDLVMKIIKGDLRIGASRKLISEAYPDLFPRKICMLASTYDADRIKFPAYVDIKLDGVRCIATREGDSYSLVSRSNKAFKNFKTIEEELLQLSIPDDAQVDGEVMGGHFQDLMKTLQRKTDGIEMAKDSVYNIFDLVIPEKTQAQRAVLLEDIRGQIARLKLTHLNVMDWKFITDEEELKAFYQEAVRNGFEGIMIKDPDAYYEFKRSRSWMKMKPEESEDLEVVGFEEGTGKYVGKLGALVCQLPNGDTVAVGTGYSDEAREELWDKRNLLRGQMVEVKFQEKTKDGSLRFPVYMRFRPDK